MPVGRLFPVPRVLLRFAVVRRSDQRVDGVASAGPLLPSRDLFRAPHPILRTDPRHRARPSFKAHPYNAALIQRPATKHHKKHPKHPFPPSAIFRARGVPPR